MRAAGARHGHARDADEQSARRHRDGPRRGQDGQEGLGRARDGPVRDDERHGVRRGFAAAASTAARHRGARTTKTQRGEEGRRRRPRTSERRRGAPTRAWFPETFLFEPLVVTDDSGAATVPVRVPDRLTTWHVLALAHSRTGAQGGAVDELPRHAADLRRSVVPKRLVVGDKIRLPIQVVNTTDEPIASTLDGHGRATRRSPAVGGARTIPAQGSLVDYATLDADHAGHGQAQRRRSARPTPSMRTIEVAPAGKPVTVTRSGTLAAPRTLDDRPARPAPIRRPIACACSCSRARSRCCARELGVSTVAQRRRRRRVRAAARRPRAGAARGARRQAGSRRAARRSRSSTGQRAIRDARTLDVSTRDAARRGRARAPAEPGARAARRARRGLPREARSGPTARSPAATGWTLQRVLVATAEATRAVGRRERRPPAQRQRATARRGARRRRVRAQPRSASTTATPRPRSSRAAR